MSDIELKPCPFCGEPAQLLRDGKTAAHACYLLDRELRFDAIAWNTRYEPTCKNISGMNPVDYFECSECGRSFEVTEWLDPMETRCGDDSAEFSPMFCPNCGARVINE